MHMESAEQALEYLQGDAWVRIDSERTLNERFAPVDSTAKAVSFVAVLAPDLVVDRDRVHMAPGPDPYSTLVYAARGSDVRTTIVDGDVLVDDFAPLRVDRAEVAAEARAAAHDVAGRAAIR